MKFKIGKTKHAKDLEKARRRQWHKWFAWRPVTVGENEEKYNMAWLCTVYRKEDYVDNWGYTWVYKDNISDVMEDVLIDKTSTRPVVAPPSPNHRRVKPTPTPSAGVRRI